MMHPCLICDDATDRPDHCEPCAGLLRWVRSYFADEPEVMARIDPGTRFLDDLAVDSLDYMDWLLEAEEKLDIAIGDHQAERIQTVGQFVRHLKGAGARWPDDRDIQIVKRRWCAPHRWEVIATDRS